jgi:protein-S-isoprenylcysteine O-methyltransferase Ste14
MDCRHDAANVAGKAAAMFLATAYALWGVFIVSWWIAAMWTARATVKSRGWSTLVYNAGFIIGFGLLFTPAHRAGYSIQAGFSGIVPPSWRDALWGTPALAGWMLVGLEVAGLAFAWWARLHLGALWSGMLTLREGHRVVDTGPYRLVRHPIYTGFIAAAWALALIVGAPAALGGAVVLTIVMSVKSKTEERLLRRELGEASYTDYAARTPMLVPFSPVARRRAAV